MTTQAQRKPPLPRQQAQKRRLSGAPAMKAAGYPRCSRHVARVLKLINGLPWQRVLGSGGRISLRGEFGLEQRFLLESEGVRFRGRRVDMTTFEHRFGRTRTKVAVQAAKRRLPRK